MRKVIGFIFFRIRIMDLVIKGGIIKVILRSLFPSSVKMVTLSVLCHLILYLWPGQYVL